MLTTIEGGKDEPVTLVFPSHWARAQWMGWCREEAPSGRGSRWFQMSCNRSGEVFPASSSARNDHGPDDDLSGEDERLDRVMRRYLREDPQGGRLWGEGYEIKAHIDSVHRVIARLVVDREADGREGTPKNSGFEEHPLAGLVDAVEFEEDPEPTNQQADSSGLSGQFASTETSGCCPNPDCRSSEYWDGESCGLCRHSLGGVEGTA